MISSINVITLQMKSVKAVYSGYPRCAPTGRLVDFSAYDLRRGSFVEHPEYILLVLSYTSNYFTCICSSSVITSTHIALPLLATRVTVLCCWSALTLVHKGSFMLYHHCIRDISF
jgi:hypothetical protein